MISKAGGSGARSLILFGTDEPVASSRQVSCGLLSAETVHGGLRHIRWGDLEIIRAVTFIVRDTNWGTYRLAVDDLLVEEDPDRFKIAYRASCRSDEGIVSFEIRIHGEAGGRLSFEAVGTSVGGFTTNRTGFVVLHPLVGVVGRGLDVEQTTGRSLRTRFPELIDPSTPTTDIKALAHEPRPGLRVTVSFAGEAFEMEDHRNWTDASFKTYVRPLSLGFPYTIADGEEVEQTVRIAVVDQAPPRRNPAHEKAVVTLGGPGGTVPHIGLFLDDTPSIAKNIAAKIRQAGVSFLTGRIDLRVDRPQERLDELCLFAGQLGTRLALEVVIPGIAPEGELATLAAEVASRSAKIESLLVVPARDLKSRPANTLPKGEATGEAILRATRTLFPELAIGGGMTVAFPELNRNRPPAGIDFVTHATQASIHDADDASVMETLEALPHVIRSTRAFAGHVRYRIGPATIGMPASACASTVVANPDGGRVCMAGDEPRQRSLFGAAFALGHFAIAAGEGLDAVTFATPTGPFGLFDSDGAARPIAPVITGLAASASAARIDTTVSGTLTILALAIQDAGAPVLWLANISAEKTPVHIAGRRFGTILMLDAAALTEAPSDAVVPQPFRGDTVILDSYAVCRLN